MRQDYLLEEQVQHGTKNNPIAALHFDTGIGTPYPNHFFVARHWHHYLEILYIVKGSYTFEINLQNYSLQEGDICILNPGDLHQITGNSHSTKHDVVLFDPCILGFLYDDEMQENCINPFLKKTLLLPCIYTKGTPEHQLINEKVKKLMQVSLARNNCWYLQSKVLILDILTSIFSADLMITTEHYQSNSERNKIKNYKTVISYIESQYASQISLQELAATIPCSSQYLCRFFKDIAGTSPIQYLVNYRIAQACDMLKNTRKSVLEISFDCGFENVSYFIRKFKELNHCTPQAYRKGYAANE